MAGECETCGGLGVVEVETRAEPWTFWRLGYCDCPAGDAVWAEAQRHHSPRA